MMPVTPYTEPKIQPVTTWPQTVEERITWLIGEVAELRQQVRDLQVGQQAVIEAMLRTDGDENDDADF